MAHVTAIPPILDLDLARTFVAICESGNFSRAAERVHRSASAISLQVKKLEDLLGHELFLRETRKVTVTPDGELLLGYARRLLMLNDEAMARFLAPDLAGHVRLGIPNDNGILAVPDILKRFSATHPQVTVDVILCGTNVLRGYLRDGRVDVAVHSFDPAKDRGAVIHTEPLVWLGARGGAAVDKRPIPLALAEHGCYWRADALKLLDRTDIPYRVAYSSEFCQGQIAAVEADLAVAPLPISVVSDKLVRIGKAAGLPDLPNYEMTMSLRNDADPVARALGDHVVAGFRAIAERGQRVFA